MRTVRRLVSKATRLRLPWAMRVPCLDGHPERVLELLELLKDDPATLVRRSVANNLNDLGKVHPALLVDTLRALARRVIRRRPARNRSCGLVAGATTTLRCGGRAVLTIDEWVAFVERRLVEQSAVFSDIRVALGSLEHRMDRRFEQVDARFLQVEARLDRLSEDQSKNFRWLVGIQITTLIAVVGTLLGALAAR